MTELKGRTLAPVLTVVEPADRADIERVGSGLFRTIHRDAISSVMFELRERRVGAVLLAATRCRGGELASARRLVSEFPLIPTKVVLTNRGSISPADILALGNCGVRELIDVRGARGWEALRSDLHREAAVGTAPLRVDALLSGAEPVPATFTRFLEVLFEGTSGPKTIKTVAAALGIRPSTLMSRFFRAGLPAPKRYLAFAGLVRAAQLLENPGFSVADAAVHLNHSSPQSFGRHIRLYTGLAAGEFRRQFDAARMLARFRDELVTPYRHLFIQGDLLRVPIRRGRGPSVGR